MSENTDKLEETLMLAAASAHQTYEDNSSPEYPSVSLKRSLSESSDDDDESTKTEENIKKVLHTDHEENKILDVHEAHRNQVVNHAEVVATHYNLIEDKGVQERSKSDIINLRVFHNWIKSMLINEYLTKVKDSKKQHNPPIRVHDMCGGKGGDLSKWKKGNITHLICSDIAECSLEDCKNRYATMKKWSQKRRGRGPENLFSLELIHGDAGKVRYREKFMDPSIKLDIVSCQFAFHYSFESLPQAECWFKNASECLMAGGYFIGTMIDSNEIVSRARRADSHCFGNNIYKVMLHFDADDPPLFGAKYDFQLHDGRVDCPEFLVHFPTFVKLAKKYGLKLVRKEKFFDFYNRMKHEGRQLLSSMGAFACYPPNRDKPLGGTQPDDYDHAKKFLREQGQDDRPCGTLSKSEWEVSTLYLTFAFEKQKAKSWNKDGTPCYE